MILTVFSENVTAIASLLVGLGAVVTSLISLRGAKKQAKSDCDQRIEDIKEAFRTGAAYEKREASPIRKEVA
jgi:hypothetical protein